MYLDGYRYFVPVPDSQLDADEGSYEFYNLTSTELEIFKIVGDANVMGGHTKLQGLESIAGMLNITIVELWRYTAVINSRKSYNKIIFVIFLYVEKISCKKYF